MAPPIIPYDECVVVRCLGKGDEAIPDRAKQSRTAQRIRLLDIKYPYMIKRFPIRIVQPSPLKNWFTSSVDSGMVFGAGCLVDIYKLENLINCNVR